jgi:hypothetical protein
MLDHRPPDGQRGARRVGVHPGEPPVGIGIALRDAARSRCRAVAPRGPSARTSSTRRGSTALAANASTMRLTRDGSAMSSASNDTRISPVVLGKTSLRCALLLPEFELRRSRRTGRCRHRPVRPAGSRTYRRSRRRPRRRSPSGRHNPAAGCCGPRRRPATRSCTKAGPPRRVARCGSGREDYGKPLNAITAGAPLGRAAAAGSRAG